VIYFIGMILFGIKSQIKLMANIGKTKVILNKK
jgi:hypothetical protein